MLRLTLGGYWLTEPSSPDASSSDASSSNASPSDSQQEPVRIEKLTKTFTDLESDDNGFFTSLDRGSEELRAAEWDEGLNPKEGFESYQWYYQDSADGLVPVFGNTEIYSDVTLVAEWYNPEQVEIEGVEEELDLVPAGLSDGEKITVKPAEEKTSKELQELVAQLPAKYELEEGTGVFGLNIDLTKGSGSGKITLTMNVPSVLDPEKPIKAIHIKSNGKVEVIPVDVRRDGIYGGTWKMTFTAGSFSPFYFVNGKEMLKVKINNVKNGYIAAYTRDDDHNYSYSARTYLPIGEVVELPVGTEIYYEDWGYELEDKHGELESLSLIDMDTKEKEIIPEEQLFQRIVLEKSCELEAKFKLEDYEDASDRRHNKFILWVEPSGLKDKGVYQGTPHVRMWNEEARRYQELSEYSLRVPTAQELGEIGIIGSSTWELFDYDAEKNVLTSKAELPIGYHWLPFVIHFEGKDYLYEEYEYAHGTNRNPYDLAVQVGADMEFYHSFIKFNGRYETYEGAGGRILDDRMFAYSDGMTWSKVEEVLKEDPLEFIPKMYNYEFKGWQTQTGVEYKPDTRLAKVEDDEMYYLSFTVFKNAEGKKYEVAAMVEGGSSTTQPGNQGNNNPGGGSGGRDRRNVDMTKQYAMTGSWIAGEDGWKFRTSSGEFATNTWGWINNQWYFFDNTGKMVTGWYQINGKWYYMNPAEGSMQGAMVTGWNLDLNYQAWFFLKENGEMVTGWQQIGGKWYYFNPISDGRMGAMAMNTYVDSYYVGADGAWIPAN